MADVFFQNGKILHGDVLDRIKDIKESSVDCVITSPPYWQLRDYKVKGQWGSEPSFYEFLDRLDSLMNEIKRILKDTGTVWVNLGDTYAGGKSHSDWSVCDSRFISDSKRENQKFSGIKKNQIQEKSLFGIPSRFYIRCIDNGWISRNFIPWIKDNSMPQSIKDRFTNKWEPVFFFAKNKKYYFNLDAVREPLLTKLPKQKKQLGIQIPLIEDKEDDVDIVNSKYEEGSNGERLGKLRASQRKMADIPGQRTQGIHRNRMEGKPDFKQDTTLGPDGKPLANYKGFNDRWKKEQKKYGNSATSRIYAYMHGVSGGNEKGKNPGDVFHINPRPFPNAHFATFPVDLPEKIIKCACPPNGVVFDPFFGAGTIALAAEKLGRNWLGIELKEEYIEICEKRLRPHDNQRL